MKKNFAFYLGLLVVQKLIGQVTLTVDSDLLLGKKEITTTTKEFTLLPQAALAFKEMQTAAKKDSIDLKVSLVLEVMLHKRAYGIESSSVLQEEV